MSATRSSGATQPRPAELVVSVVVPVRNDAARLSELLAALREQTLTRERFEVLIGDDGSTDGSTTGLATDEGWIQVFPGPPINSYASRNRAARAARADVLAFCDSDCRPEPEWLEAGLRALDQADVAAGLINFTPPERSTLWTLLTIDLWCDQEQAVRRGRAAGGNLFVRRELFERLGGFDETLPNGSDSDFVARAVANGARLRLARDAVVWHPTRDSAKGFVRKIWALSRRAGIRDARRGGGPGVRSLSFWCPPLEIVRSRRRFGAPLLLNRRRLEACGVDAGPKALPALLALYLVVPYIRRAGKLAGWFEGRRLRRVARRDRAFA